MKQALQSVASVRRGLYNTAFPRTPLGLNKVQSKFCMRYVPILPHASMKPAINIQYKDATSKTLLMTFSV